MSEGRAPAPIKGACVPDEIILYGVNITDQAGMARVSPMPRLTIGMQAWEGRGPDEEEGGDRPPKGSSGRSAVHRAAEKTDKDEGAAAEKTAKTKGSTDKPGADTKRGEGGDNNNRGGWGPPNRDWVIGFIYAYAYQGRCYRLDKPKIFIFKVLDGEEEGEPAVGCFYREGDGYVMWRIRARDEIVELDPEVDRAEKLILEANLPNRRSPNTYDSNMQMAGRIRDRN